MTENLKTILEEYADSVKDLLAGNLIGIYLTGSAALGGFHDEKSDIDFTTLVRKPLNEEQTLALGMMHRAILAKHPKNALEGHYITPEELGKKANEIAPVVSYYDGKMSKSHHGISIVTWFTLKKCGVCVCGVPIDERSFTAAENDLTSYVIQNVNTYWKKWLSDSKGLISNKGLYSLTSSAIEWVVLGISRMHYTLATKDIASKDAMIRYAMELTPEKYHRIIREATAIRTKSGEKQYRSIFKRRSDTIQYLEYMIAECNRLAGRLQIA